MFFNTVSQFMVYMTSTKHLSVMKQPGVLVVIVSDRGTRDGVMRGRHLQGSVVKENLKVDIFGGQPPPVTPYWPGFLVLPTLVLWG